MYIRDEPMIISRIVFELEIRDSWRNKIIISIKKEYYVTCLFNFYEFIFTSMYIYNRYIQNNYIKSSDKDNHQLY